MTDRGATPRLAAVFEAEELAGLRLATRGRVISLAVIAALLVVLAGWPEVLYYWALLVVFALTSVVDYALSRRGLAQPWARYVFVAVDFALLTVTVLAPNPLSEQLWPQQMAFRNGNIIYFFLLVAAVAFGYTPRLMLWAGLAAVASWTVGAFWLAALPGTVTTMDLAPDASIETVMAVLLDPRYVNVNIWLQDVVLVLLVAGLLAFVVRRSRDLVVRQAGAARERANLARYFPPTMVDRLADLDDPFGTVRAQSVAVLFADIVGFTRLAERQTPDQVIALLREFHARMERAVFDHHGTLDKFLGDGLMATFGTPEAGPRDASNALRAARAMLAAVAEWNRARAEAGEAPIRLSIGLHYGEAVLGDVGSERRLEFAVLGDTVNVASRLEEQTRALDCAMIASDALVRAVRAEAAGEADAQLADFTEQGSQPLRGRAESVALWALP